MELFVSLSHASRCHRMLRRFGWVVWGPKPTRAEWFGHVVVFDLWGCRETKTSLGGESTDLRQVAEPRMFPPQGRAVAE